MWHGFFFFTAYVDLQCPCKPFIYLFIYFLNSKRSDSFIPHNRPAGHARLKGSQQSADTACVSMLHIIFASS